MPKVTRSKRRPDREVVSVRTQPNKLNDPKRGWRWWTESDPKARADQLLETVAFLKQNQQWRYRQAAIYARMYGNMPMFNFVGSSITKFTMSQSLPIDRPTMNVVQSCVDTKVSRITQDRPKPVFLTDNGDYKEQQLAEEMNAFIGGELYQVDAYELGEYLLRDADIFGTGVLKVFKKRASKDEDGKIKHRVTVERRLATELLTDPNDALYGKPRQLFELQLIDRSVLAEMFPKHKAKIMKAEEGFPDSAADSSKTISDQVLVAEAWHLPSGEDAGDGAHVIVCTEGELFYEEYEKDCFPFVFLHSSASPLGFWGQGAPERLMGTQVEINKLLMTISSAINLVGVPRVFVEEGSKVVKAHLNNAIGSIVTYRGTKPEYEVAPCMPGEVYAQLQRLIEFAYQQEGIAQLMATGQKPAGLNSGEAQRAYEDIQSDRFAALQKRYSNAFVDLAYLILDTACDIAEAEGSYETVFPDKDGTTAVDLPDVKKLKENPFVIQCFTESALPKDPAGRKQTIIEYMQAGLYTPQEGRRLLGNPDTKAQDKLLDAGEDRIRKVLSDIVEDGKYMPPDPFMDPDVAQKLCVQFYNLYTAKNLEEKKAQMLRTFFSQCGVLKQEIQAAMAPPPGMGMPGAAGPGGPAGTPAAPQAPPTNDLLPMANGQ